MAVHLIKLSVGSESLADLAAWQEQKIKEKKRNRQTPELMHITRHMPKRAEEILNGGSIYWVIKGHVWARQQILELRPVQYDGTPHCGIIYNSELIRVRPRPYRPFQGWRYLEAKDAPADIAKGTGEDKLPEKIYRELSELGLV